MGLIKNKISFGTTDFFSILNNGEVELSRIIMSIMIFLLVINILWKILKNGFSGSIEEIVKNILVEVSLKSPYFIFVAMYPAIMKKIIVPVFLFKLPTYIYSDFIKASNIIMKNGKYLTYADLAAHIFRKGIPLIVASFGNGILAQPDAIGGLFGFFGTIWKTILQWFTSPEEVAQNSLNTLGMLFSISRMIVQTVFFRPLTVGMGLMTILTLLKIVLNMFFSTLSFIISTSVGLFYMIFAMHEITRDKALNTLEIIISGFLQYLVNFAVVILLSMAIQNLGEAVIKNGVIITPFNLVNMVKIFLCISFLQNIIYGVAQSLADSF
nr:hypothetical protein [uncultured Leptotrichia sp.]